MSVVQFVNKSSGKFNLGCIPDTSQLYGYPVSKDKNSINTPSQNLQSDYSTKISGGLIGSGNEVSLEVIADISGGYVEIAGADLMRYNNADIVGVNNIYCNSININGIDVSGYLNDLSGNDVLLDSKIASIDLYVKNPRMAQYYKTTQQNAPTGNTDLTFDGEASWNNTGGAITHVNGTKDFTVVTSGVYFLEFNAVIIPNGATWTSAANKVLSIDITRGTEQGIIQTTALQASGVGYVMSVTGTFNLLAGDIINCRHNGTATGTPLIQCIQNSFDYNTFFTWTFIKS